MVHSMNRKTTFQSKVKTLNARKSAQFRKYWLLKKKSQTINLVIIYQIKKSL